MNPAPPSVASPSAAAPLVSVVVLNYNGQRWLGKCLASLRDQTNFDQLEIIVADNASPDQSDRLAAATMAGWPNGRVMQHGANLGFCEGNNRAARSARGRWLLFLNNDAWLEADCLAILIREVELHQAGAAMPLVLNYADATFQSLGASGFDIFGLTSTRLCHPETREVFMPEGCSYLIRRDLFEQLGGFDAAFFMYAEEYDLSWRVWISGHKALAVPAARLHHRGAAEANPEGGDNLVELRTTDTKRFYANRNGLLLVLKNCGGVLLPLIPLHLLLLLLEAGAWFLVVRRWSFVQRSYLQALADCWRLRDHIRAERRRIKKLRRRSNWWMLRFLKPQLNRWHELVRARKLGFPKVSAR